MYTDTRLINSKTDLAELLITLKAPWKTMDTDMNTAQAIISRHTQNNRELKSTALVSFEDKGDHNFEIVFPDWQQEVEKIFLLQYGLIDGKLIFNKVLMRIFQIARGTEQPLH